MYLGFMGIKGGGERVNGGKRALHGMIGVLTCLGFKLPGLFLVQVGLLGRSSPPLPLICAVWRSYLFGTEDKRGKCARCVACGMGQCACWKRGLQEAWGQKVFFWGVLLSSEHNGSLIDA